jgi:hypothetical protein
VNERVSLAAIDQPAVHWPGHDPGDHERQGETSPEEAVEEAGRHRAGNEDHPVRQWIVAWRASRFVEIA